MDNVHFSREYKVIPTRLTEKQFNEFVLPHLSKGKRGPTTKLSFYHIFCYILLLIYTGMQWQSLPIKTDLQGDPEIHYSRLHRTYQRWASDGSLQRAFEASVQQLAGHDLLDVSILHGDGTSTAAKKGGDVIGYNGHKHHKGEKIVAIVDRHANIISPFTVASANRHEGPLFSDALSHVKRIFTLIGLEIKGITMSLDSAYDSLKNRKMIFNSGMIPNIKENKRNRKNIKRGRKRFYSEAIFQERFSTVERSFAWEDKFKRLLLRFEHKSQNHLGMKFIAYMLINLRHFCQA